ncbi:MAG: ribosomal protein [Anaerophaga sp.]|uniref:50S ribosomal protein L4 n=1 Tax=Anaerophaga thermohalophila TaxID=177400 RepID=UPI000237CFA2|nr:50S ribosomal protein L4 [Anaerophaga thermohalophila]MBZ4676683.1 ribosomal protein [Anaerophaga sp.]MDI3520243.1 large subunit ribosomal protein [Anaerophaga sp.]MDK2840812.1 large subunit ribosomal protein [Anaerophaga sp.]MDN5290035.1 large subunit ribosomal protein [Anaerophaga sp.]
MELNVVNIQGQETGRKVQLPDSVFGIEPNDHAIYLDVKQYLANNRQGTHKAKERAEIAGSTRKIKRQKGTGTARAGSIKSPVFRGGGRAFGPKPRDYRFKLNKKLKQLARKSALAYKARNNAIVVVEDFKLEAPKTKEFVSIRKNLNLDGKKTLMIFREIDRNVYLSSRNVPKTQVFTLSGLNTYNIMNAQSLVLAESSVEEIAQHFNA